MSLASQILTSANSAWRIYWRTPMTAIEQLSSTKGEKLIKHFGIWLASFCQHQSHRALLNSGDATTSWEACGCYQENEAPAHTSSIFSACCRHQTHPHTGASLQDICVLLIRKKKKHERKVTEQKVTAQGSLKNMDQKGPILEPF